MMKAIKLHFTTPVHFGRGREELDKTELIYHSDSLKSAIYAVGIQLFEDWKDEKHFFNNFRISSCFPFAKDDFFLPKPHLNRKISFGNTADDKIAKKAKKISYFEKSVFENYINSKDELFEINQSHITPDGTFICQNNDVFTRIEKNGLTTQFNFYKTEVQQRVTVPNEWEKENSKPFYIDRIYFEKDCGLYFVAEFNNPDIEKQVFQTLKLLGENGIGTDRTVGNGIFDFKTERDVSDFIIKLNSNNNKFLSLGLYLPTLKEHEIINFDESAWNLIKRGGYLAGSEIEEFKHLRKKSIYMFGEGSVFQSEIFLNGKFEDLSPLWNDEKMHSVWRDGQCLMLKI